jgi:hypothetical protein
MTISPNFPNIEFQWFAIGKTSKIQLELNMQFSVWHAQCSLSIATYSWPNTHQMKTNPLLIALAVFASETVANAAITLYTDIAAWDAAVTGKAEVNLAAQVAELAIHTTGSALSLPQGQTLSFDVDLEGVQVPTTWGTWSGGNTPGALFSADTPLTGTFNAPIDAFGMEIQPNNLDVFTIEMQLSDGSIISQSVNGNGGARFFGWVNAGGPGITDMGVSTDDPDGFAMGRMVQGTPRAASVPDPGATMVMLLVSVSGLVAGGRFLKSPTKS